MNTRQKLRHLRIRDANGVVSNRGGATVAAIVDENGKVLRFAVAFCHSKDNFNRLVGKVKATNRLGGNGAFTSDVEWDGLLSRVQDILYEYHGQIVGEQRKKIQRKIAVLERKLKKLG